MKTTGLVKGAGAAVALAILSACGSSSAVAPSSAAPNGTYVGRTLFLNGRPVTAARLNPSPRYATLVPDEHKKPTDYEYVDNDYDTYASIFDYPKSIKQVGSINGVGGQACTNVLYGYGKKIIWIVAGPSQIEEFKVPSTPVKTMSVSFSFPSSCGMDSSGDLAIGDLDTGHVAIFTHASGKPAIYSTPLDEEFFDGYDPQGDLFADGFTGDRSGFELVELPKGTTKFETITTSNSVEFPGSVQWDGTYMTVFDQLANAVFQYTVSGTKATLVGTVQLNESSDCAQTWIVQDLIYCGDAGNDEGYVFKYPAGGSPIATFEGNFVTPLGMTAAKN